MYKKIISFLKLLKKSIISFVDNDLITHAAAISYYMVFSLPSMLLIVLWMAAYFYKEVAVHNVIFEKTSSLIGEKAATLVLSTIEKLSVQEPTWLATLLGVGILIFFATTVFEAMRTALNIVAKVEAPASVNVSIWLMIRARMIAFALLVTISFLLLVSLVFDVFLSSLSHYLAQWIGELSEMMLRLSIFFLDFLATILIFALDFRYLPNVHLKWIDAFWGAFLTACLFTIGKSIISIVIKNNQLVDIYDAAGSVLILMLWVYYAAIIFLFGATFTFEGIKSRENEVH